MTFRRPYIFIFWRILMVFCIFIIIHYLKQLNIGITKDNYIFWAIPFLLWAEFGIQLLLKYENKIDLLYKLRKKSIAISILSATNFVCVNILAPALSPARFPLIIDASFTLVILHGQLGAFAITAAEKDISKNDDVATRQCAMCGFYFGQMVSTFTKCPSCGMYQPLWSGGFRLIFMGLFPTMFFFALFSYFGQPIDLIIKFFDGEHSKFYPIVTTSFLLIAFYYWLRLVLSTGFKSNDVFSEKFHKYGLQLYVFSALFVSAQYLGEKQGFPLTPEVFFNSFNS